MCGIALGWRKASKCICSKELARRVQCRIKFLKIKRRSIVKQFREGIVELLRTGQPEAAFSHADELYKDQSLLCVYDLLQHFCEFLILHLPYIRKHKVYPNEINEAISTLIFAASWCGDLPELQTIRKLFKERNGSKFIKAITELHPGNHVNIQVKEKLCLKSVPDNMKLSLIVDLAKDHAFQAQHPGRSNKRLGSDLLLICGNDNLHWEGFIFEEITKCHDYDSNWLAELLPRTRKTSSQSELQVQFDKISFNLDEVEEIQINTPQVDCDGDKTIFLFNTTLLSERNNYNGFSGASLLVSPHSCEWKSSNSMKLTGISDLKECQVCHYSLSTHSASTKHNTVGEIQNDILTESSSKFGDAAEVSEFPGFVNSSSYRHVHPKLPDYDELVAKFKALEQEQNKTGQSLLHTL